MATLNLRNIPDPIHRQLRVQAAHHGRSMEAEARTILQAACASGAGKQSAESLRRWVSEMYAGRKPQNVSDELIAERRREAANE